MPLTALTVLPNSVSLTVLLAAQISYAASLQYTRVLSYTFPLMVSPVSGFPDHSSAKQGPNTQGFSVRRNGTTVVLNYNRNFRSRIFTGSRKHVWEHSITPYDRRWRVESLGQRALARRGILVPFSPQYPWYCADWNRLTVSRTPLKGRSCSR